MNIEIFHDQKEQLRDTFDNLHDLQNEILNRW